MRLLLCFILGVCPLVAALAQTSQTIQGDAVPATVPVPEKEIADPAPAEVPDPVVPNDRAPELMSTDWRENLLVSVPATICADNTWHRECFNVRESQCLGATTEVTNDCVNYVEAQQPVSSMTATQLFEQTRVCVITLYERRFARRFKFIQRCTDRTKW